MMRSLHQVNRLTKGGSVFFEKQRKGFLFFMIPLLAISCLLIFSCASNRPQNNQMLPAQAFWEDSFPKTAGKFLSWYITNNRVYVSFQRVTLTLRVVGESVWEVSLVRRGDVLVEYSYACVSNLGALPIEIIEQQKNIVLQYGDERLFISKKDGTLQWWQGNTLLLSQKDPLRLRDESAVVGFSLDSGAVFGLAEKALGLNLIGQTLTFYNKDTYKYQRGTDPIYLSIPFAIIWKTNENVGIFLDNPGQSFWDIGKTDSKTLRVGVRDGDITFYLMHGKTLRGVLVLYTSLTGRPPLPPLWAFGYQQSRFSYFPQKRVLEVARTLREKNLPADVIYLDIDFMEGKRSFTYDTNRFPDPVTMIRQLHNWNFSAVTIVNPGVAVRKGYFPYESGVREDVFVKQTNGNFAQGTVWPGFCVFPDYTKPEARQWWGNLFTNLLVLGFDGFWNDMNEPSVFNGKNGTLDSSALHYDGGRFSPHYRIHNAYGLTMAQATYEGLMRLQPEKRPFILARAGYAGIQRYAFVWTGDNSATWDHLRLNLTMVLNLGLAGVPFAGADIGGYSYTPSPELFTRWMQMGAFLPFFRNHTEQGTAPQEIWAFGDKVEEISRRYLFARYRLLPMWYTLAYEAHEYGTPLVRPLVWNDALLSEDAFWLGDFLLVLPVLEEGKTVVTTKLPQGLFYEWKTLRAYENEASLSVTMEDIPLLFKAGSVLCFANLPETLLKQGKPIGEVLQAPDASFQSTKDLRNFSLWVVGGMSGEGSFYWDDGISQAYRQGKRSKFSFRWVEETKSARLIVSYVGEKQAAFHLPFQWLVVQPCPPILSVSLNGQQLFFLHESNLGCSCFSEESLGFIYSRNFLSKEVRDV